MKPEDDPILVFVDLGVMIRFGESWVDIPGTDLQAMVLLTDTPDRFWIRKRPVDE